MGNEQRELQRGICREKITDRELKRGRDLPRGNCREELGSVQKIRHAKIAIFVPPTHSVTLEVQAQSVTSR